MANATYGSCQDERRQVRFSDEMFSAPPPKPAPASAPESMLRHTCPFCAQPLPQDRTSITAMFFGGLRRLFMSLLMIVGAVIRFARFIVAAVLCLVGLIGSGFRAVGIRIAHPQDRCLLSRRQQVRR